MPGRVYGREVFSPKYISIQILTVNSSFYAIYSTVLLALSLLTRLELPRFREIFTDASLDLFGSMEGLDGVLALGITAAALSWVLKVVVERSRKVLDFVITVHFFHFILTWMIGGFPRRASWWIAHGCAVAISTVGGETLCRREENADIVLSTLERE